MRRKANYQARGNWGREFSRKIGLKARKFGHFTALGNLVDPRNRFDVGDFCSRPNRSVAEFANVNNPIRYYTNARRFPSRKVSLRPPRRRYSRYRPRQISATPPTAECRRSETRRATPPESAPADGDSRYKRKDGGSFRPQGRVALSATPLTIRDTCRNYTISMPHSHAYLDCDIPDRPRTQETNKRLYPHLSSVRISPLSLQHEPTHPHLQCVREIESQSPCGGGGWGGWVGGPSGREKTIPQR